MSFVGTAGLEVYGIYVVKPGTLQRCLLEGTERAVQDVQTGTRSFVQRSSLSKIQIFEHSIAVDIMCTLGSNSSWICCCLRIQELGLRVAVRDFEREVWQRSLDNSPGLSNAQHDSQWHQSWSNYSDETHEGKFPQKKSDLEMGNSYLDCFPLFPSFVKLASTPIGYRD